MSITQLASHSLSRRSQGIGQVGNLSFSFSTLMHTNVFEWVRNECKWDYDMSWADDFQYVIIVTFKEIGGAIEFKMRF